MQWQETQSAPSPYTHEDLMRAEEMLRQLGVSQAMMERCKRCQIPVSEAEKDCQAMCSFFQAILAEFKGPNAPIP